MRESKLKSKSLVLLVKQRLDDLRVTQAIPDAIYQAKANPKIILESLNSADIDTCGMLDIDVTAVAFIPSGVAEFNMFSQDTYQYEMIQATADSDVVDPQSIENLLNTQSYVNYGKMRGSIMHRYTTAPIGNASPNGKYRMVSEYQFAQYKQHGYLDIGEGFDGVAIIKPETGRCRLSDPAPYDMFLTWDTTIMPSKIDVTDFSNFQDAKQLIDEYEVATPAFAKDLLIAKTMLGLLPPIGDAYVAYTAVEQRAYQQALMNVSRSTETFRAEPYLGPG